MPMIATSMLQVIRKAPTRVNNPSSTNAPPSNSPSAAAASHNQAGRIKGNGANCEKLSQLFQPGPLNEPKTFCAPCPRKIAPSDRRRGTVIQVEEVEVSLRSMTVTFRIRFVWNGSNYKTVFSRNLRGVRTGSGSDRVSITDTTLDREQRPGRCRSRFGSP